ncbi:hypothetical protein A3Q56_06753 [Intoshia linei]|uniref:Uncharacterized protein n=1 Tax=Intoshia linei TaxID=1819745 RepID=A0A177AVX9_9BILA|nr:hypothetical protein A3Q56_06753 [Intoshia linei]
MKNSVKRACVRTEFQLKMKISSAFDDITETHCDSFYRKMLPYLARCERNEVINE